MLRMKVGQQCETWKREKILSLWLKINTSRLEMNLRLRSHSMKQSSFERVLKKNTRTNCFIRWTKSSGCRRPRVRSISCWSREQMNILLSIAERWRILLKHWRRVRLNELSALQMQWIRWFCLKLQLRWTTSMILSSSQRWWRTFISWVLAYYRILSLVQIQQNQLMNMLSSNNLQVIIYDLQLWTLVSRLTNYSLTRQVSIAIKNGRLNQSSVIKPYWLLIQ